MNQDKLFINTLRTLSADQVENAGSGHLGMPLGSAPMAYELFKNHINLNPKDTKWINRDRFIYSSGHGTPLLYSLFHLFGYEMTIKDLKEFRELESITPGHPEYSITDGVDATTGPLGQGFAMAVGFAIAEAHLASVYNKDDLKIVDHYTYVICGDGDLMEGVAIEAASIAGTLELSKLIVLFDSNDVCLDGKVSDSTVDNIKAKFESINWEHIYVKNGEDIESIGKAIEQAKTSNKPSLIEVKNTIGYGTLQAGTNDAHSDPLGPDGIKYLRDQLEWKYDGEFFVPDEVYEVTNLYIKEGQIKQNKWNNLAEKYKEKYPQDYNRLINGDEILNNIDMDDFEKIKEPMAIRVASQEAINYFHKKMPYFIGGSADLAKSNKVSIKSSGYMTKNDYSASNIAFGVREFGMAAIMNGITLHGNIRAFGSTFLVFSEYMKSAIRHAALQGINPVFVYSHDSILVGPDGPTHQPIEQLPSLRAVPNLDVIRPADANETFYAWKYANKNDRPTVLILARQELPILECTSYENLEKGAYIVKDCEDYDATIIATGSEVSLSLSAVEILKDEGIKLRVVNMPSWELFEHQKEEYQNSIIDRSKPVVSIEASSGFGWERYTRYTKNVIGVNEFGQSGNGNALYDLRGFSIDSVASKIKEILNK